MKTAEIKIRLPIADIKKLEKGGRVTVDVQQPPQEVEVMRTDLNSMGDPERTIPQSDKNGFKKRGSCLDCGNACFHHVNFSCNKKTFKGEAYKYYADSYNCDLWKPNLKIIGGQQRETKTA